MPTVAGVVELVDTGDLKSPGSNTVPVRVRSPAPRFFQMKYRGVEQLVARRAHNPEVAGSSPVSATTGPWNRNGFGVFSFLVPPVTKYCPTVVPRPNYLFGLWLRETTVNAFLYFSVLLEESGRSVLSSGITSIESSASAIGFNPLSRSKILTDSRCCSSKRWTYIFSVVEILA